MPPRPWKTPRTIVPKPARKAVNDNAPTPAKEWRLQAAQVRRLRDMPEYGKRFILVGGMEAGKRGPQAATQAKATGLTAGHPDLTFFFEGGRCAFIENKTTIGRLSPAQVAHHAALRALGHVVEVVVAKDEDDAASQALAHVRHWLAVPVPGPSLSASAE